MLKTDAWPRLLRWGMTATLVLQLLFAGCSAEGEEAQHRLSMFVAVDISGSFMRGGHYDDAIEFLAHYLHAHLTGMEGLEVPNVLFVGSIGGAKEDEAKTFFPKQIFENKSTAEIAEKLREIFPKGKENPYTDYNAFFEQIARTVRNKKLVLRPISIVMISDGVPDVKSEGVADFRSIDLKPLEGLARNITIRLLYTNAEVGRSWQTKVKRNRVRIWTQDADVMVSWKDPKIFIPERPLEDQKLFANWIKENVDYGVASRRVD